MWKRVIAQFRKDPLAALAAAATIAGFVLTYLIIQPDKGSSTAGSPAMLGTASSMASRSAAVDDGGTVAIKRDAPEQPRSADQMLNTPAKPTTPTTYAAHKLNDRTWRAKGDDGCETKITFYINNETLYMRQSQGEYGVNTEYKIKNIGQNIIDTRSEEGRDEKFDIRESAIDVYEPINKPTEAPTILRSYLPCP